MRHPPRGVAASEFPPLCNIPHCCLPQESGPCLSSSVTDHPLRPVRRHCLGEPLPHQLADTIQPDPLAKKLSLHSLRMKEYGVLAAVSNCYPPPRGTLAIHYSPVRHLDCIQQARPFLVRLACVKHAASVHSEPGSNSPLKMKWFEPLSKNHLIVSN